VSIVHVYPFFVSVGEQTVATRIEVPWQRGGEKGTETEHFLFFFSLFFSRKAGPTTHDQPRLEGQKPDGD
jgi:hypothetical protein